MKEVKEEQAGRTEVLKDGRKGRRHGAPLGSRKKGASGAQGCRQGAGACRLSQLDLHLNVGARTDRYADVKFRFNVVRVPPGKTSISGCARLLFVPGLPVRVYLGVDV